MTNPNDSVYPEMNELMYSNDRAVFLYNAIPLTKREYFAAMALQGILSCDHIQLGKIAAINAIRYADDLINQLNEKPSS